MSIEMTWNLLFCVVAFPALGWLITNKLNTLEKNAEARHEEHRAELEKLWLALGTKADNVDVEKSKQSLWRRLHSHYHMIECDNKDCGELRRTGEVVIPHDVP